MSMAGLSFSSMRFYAFYIGRLTTPGPDRRLMKRAMIKSALKPVHHLIAVLLAGVNLNLAPAFYVAIPVMFFLPSRLERFASSKPTAEGCLE
jgi:hypothetical protein